MKNYMKNEIWKARQIEKEMFFETKLKGTSISLTEEQEKKIFEYAWDQGHSAGEYEVEVIFDRLVELVESCLK